MEWSRKAATVGGVLTIVMLVFVAFHAKTFTGYVPYGNLMLVISIVSALLMCPAIGIRWDTNKRLYGILLLVFFLVVPLLMEIVVERCNGKFITEFYGPEDWLDNYNVILLLYLLLFAVSGSVRTSVMVVSPVLLLFGIANLFIKEFKGGFDGLKMTYIGDGNNMANSLIVGGLTVGMDVAIACPNAYQPDPTVLEFTKKYPGKFTMTDNILEAAQNSDVLFTDVWASMGQEEEAAERRKVFTGYQINDAVIDVCHKDVMVQHCLPAHRGEEITAEVFEAHANEIFEEAENRLHAQKAVMVRLMKKA